MQKQSIVLAFVATPALIGSLCRIQPETFDLPACSCTAGQTVSTKESGFSKRLNSPTDKQRNLMPAIVFRDL